MDERKVQLDALAEQQQVWAAQGEQERGKSPFTNERLPGADVFYLACRTLAASATEPAALAAAAARLRTDDVTERTNLLDLSPLHLEGATRGRAHLERAILAGRSCRVPTSLGHS